MAGAWTYVEGGAAGIYSWRGVGCQRQRELRDFQVEPLDRWMEVEKSMEMGDQVQGNGLSSEWYLEPGRRGGIEQHHRARVPRGS